MYSRCYKNCGSTTIINNLQTEILKQPVVHSHDEDIDEIDRSTFIEKAVQSIKKDRT